MICAEFHATITQNATRAVNAITETRDEKRISKFWRDNRANWSPSAAVTGSKSKEHVTRQPDFDWHKSYDLRVTLTAINVLMSSQSSSIFLCLGKKIAFHMDRCCKLRDHGLLVPYQRCYVNLSSSANDFPTPVTQIDIRFHSNRTGSLAWWGCGVG